MSQMGRQRTSRDRMNECPVSGSTTVTLNGGKSARCCRADLAKAGREQTVCFRAEPVESGGIGRLRHPDCPRGHPCYQETGNGGR
jgi:hypothetical protein